MQWLVEGRVRTLALEPGEGAGEFAAELDGEPVVVGMVLQAPGVVSVIVRSGPLAGRAFRCVLDQDAEGGRVVTVDGRGFAYQLQDPRSLKARKRVSGSEEGTLLLKATMAGRVVRVLQEAGSLVAAQDGMVVVEAMKMQNELRSPKAGRVTEMRVKAGEMVSAGQVLAVIE